ncbi:class I SAM-dependent methyltransferase [Myxococcaceae bacterium GXIMD 01537]
MLAPFAVRSDAAPPEVREAPNALDAPVKEWADPAAALSRAQAWLDRVHEEMAGREDLQESMESLHRGLWALRQELPQESWRHFCKELVRKHPLRAFVHQCPFTRHAFERPRGYAGDAALIDYLYMDRAADELHAGREVYRYMHQQPSAHSVRERRLLLAQELDKTAERVGPGARILSVACGHLREAEISRAVSEGRIAELVAFDQDPVSLAEITRHHHNPVIRPVNGSIRALLAGKASFSDMDFVYSAGLYDYLAENTAARLTSLLFNMLRPGGELLVANFAVHPPETGYMEAFMDWWLVYRDERQMEALAAEIPASEIASINVFRDSQQNVIYMMLRRA